MEEAEVAKIRVIFGAKLRRYREAIGLSQEKLGFEADVSMRFISLLETGKRQPSLTTMVALARALNVSLGDLLSEIDP